MKSESLLIIVSLLFLLSIYSAFSANYSGKIINLQFLPSIPKLLEQVVVNIEIKNTGDLTNAYFLSIVIVKDGIVKYQNEITLTLEPGGTIVLSPNFIPDEIGEYNVIIKLSDKYKTHLFDSKISSFYVTSDYGPFDLYVDLPSYTVEPGSKLPIIINLANRGSKGSDVTVHVSLECFNSSSIKSSFVYYLDANTTTQKLVYIPVCNEIGIHTLTSSIEMLGKILATSSVQININQTLNKLQLSFPESFSITQNQTEFFEIIVKNVGNSDVRDVKFFIGNVPKEWVEITPEKIDVLKPNQSAYFILKISIPSDANAMIYPITLTAAGRDAIINERSELDVIQGEFVKLEYPTGPIQILFDYSYYIAIIAVLSLLVVIILVKIKIKRKQRYDRRSVLKKIKSSIT